MPNHVKNRLTTYRLDGGLDKLLSQGNNCIYFDFNKIIKSPEVVVQDSIGSHLKDEARIRLGFLQQRPES